MDLRNRLQPEVKAYLQRIGYEGPLDCSAGVLAQLQRCHLQAVPYENFDILHGIPLSLETPDLYQKIVSRRRGGYCFELNALFGWLLQELGYPVTSLMARFWRDEPNPPPKRRHQVLAVEAEGERYLCDVGVGGIVPRQCLKIAEGLEQAQGDERYRIHHDANYGWMLCESKRGQWERLYSFTDEPQLPKDFIMTAYWCEHAPESIFRREPMVCIHTPDGRNTLSGAEFRIFTSIGVHTFTPQTRAEYSEALQTYFGIVLDG